MPGATDLLDIIIGLVSIPLGILAGHGAVRLFNRIPDGWYWEEGEIPEDQLKRKDQRLRDHPWIWFFSAFFLMAALKLGTEDWMFALPAFAAIWILVILILADIKTMILPDQLIALLALTGFGFIPYHEGFLPPVFGLLLGLIPMMLIYGIGRLVTKDEVMGFGDVKLMAALGFILGPAGILFTLAAGFLASGIYYGTLLMMRKLRLRDEGPLGPFLAGAAILYLLLYKDLHLILSVI